MPPHFPRPSSHRSAAFPLFFRASEVNVSPVKRLSKVLLIGCAVFVLIVVGAPFGLVSYGGSENGRTLMEADLAKAPDLPLQIAHASLGWNGIRLTGARIVV